MPSIAADANADAQIAATALTAVADAQRAADAANAVLTAALLAAGSTAGSTSSTDGFAQCHVLSDDGYTEGDSEDTRTSS